MHLSSSHLQAGHLGSALWAEKLGSARPKNIPVALSISLLQAGQLWRAPPSREVLVCKALAGPLGSVKLLLQMGQLGQALHAERKLSARPEPSPETSPT